MYKLSRHVKNRLRASVLVCADWCHADVTNFRSHFSASREFPFEHCTCTCHLCAKNFHSWWKFAISFTLDMMNGSSAFYWMKMKGAGTREGGIASLLGERLGESPSSRTRD